MITFPIRVIACLVFFASWLWSRNALSDAQPLFRAGAYAIDITPTNFPVNIIGGFLQKKADQVVDPLHARALVLDDGATRLSIVVVDSCMLPRELIDKAKALATASTGISTDRIMVSATHTHSAPAAMGGLGTNLDERYAELLPGRIADGIPKADKNLAPALVGWTVVDDWQHTFNRRWVTRPDKLLTDPFGVRNVRAMMHPGYENPDFIGPSGPVDPGLSLLSVQSSDGRPLALLANYSQHYFGATPVSADYFGKFAEGIGKLIGARAGEPAFVGIMSQGTSGDLMWMDCSRPKLNLSFEKYTEELMQVAAAAYAKIEHQPAASLAMAEARLTLHRRVADASRLAWAQKIVTGMDDRLPADRTEVYAREQVLIAAEPQRELTLQAIRIGDFGITALPNEVFAITGLKLKSQSPLQPTMNIELANGGDGYIPPPEQHKLGGYATWAARTAGLEEEAEPQIVETVLRLLEKVAGKPRRSIVERKGVYAEAVLASKPVAYWRLNELVPAQARDATGQWLRSLV